jgi:hypothetical protein
MESEQKQNQTMIELLKHRLLEIHQFVHHLLVTPIVFLIIFVIFMILLVIYFLYHFNVRLFSQGIKQEEEEEEESKKGPYFNSDMTYYVCSYGGCGSYMLCDYLRHFGHVEHVHSRKPPQQLEYIGANNTDNPVYGEWFNGQKIPEYKLNNFKVIYLYKDPVRAIYSRFDNPEHLLHIECDPTILLEDIVQTNQDLYKLEEFFDNYTNKKYAKGRNYPIYCVKYEDFWDHLPEFNQELGLQDIPALYPVKKETPRLEPYSKILHKIYKPLLKKMSKKRFIEIN